MSKGSKTARVLERDGQVVHKNGRAVAYLHEDRSADKKRNEKSIEAAALQAREDLGLPLLRELALQVTLRFYMRSPSYRYGTGRNANQLKDRAARWPWKKPDADKLARHTLDALTGVIYADDGQVVSLLAEKRYADEGAPHTEVEVTVIERQTVGVIQPDEQGRLPIAA